MTTLNVFQPSLSGDELAAVARVFHSNWPGKGPKVDEFEVAWAAHISASPTNVVSVNSCTEGLFTACELFARYSPDFLNRNPYKDGWQGYVIIPTIHFVGAAQAVLNMGAKPKFCDVDTRTLNPTLEMIERQYTRHAVGVILNHYGGVPCADLAQISEWCKQKGIWLIEDAACAPASTFGGQAVGTFGDIGVWSFDSMKIISTGDGGMMWFRDRKLADKARKQLYLGTSTVSGLTSDEPRWWEFEVEIEGARRSVMNDMAAAVGLEQLKKLAGFVERRSDIWVDYIHQLPEGVLDFPDYITGSSFYFYWIQTPRRDELAAYLKANGCYVTFRYYPLHWAYKTGDSLPNAEKAARETLLLPLHQGLTDEDIEFVCGKVREFYVR